MRYNLDTEVPDKITEVTKEYIEDFFLFMKDSGVIKNRTPTRYRGAIIALSVFLNNAYICARGYKREFPVPLSKNVYSTPCIVNGSKQKIVVSHKYTKAVIDYLKDRGLGDYVKGKATLKHLGDKQYEVLDSQVTMFTMENILYNTMRSLVPDVGYNLVTNVLFLRDSKKVNKSFRCDGYRKSVVEYLQGFNRFSLKQEIRNVKDGKDYTLQIVKIHNDSSFDRGGRVYDHLIQSMPKNERKALTINGKSTSIFDYKAFETSILYTYEGVLMEGDPYQVNIEGYDPSILRMVGKWVMTRIYYSEDRVSLIRSVGQSVAEKLNLPDLVDKGKIPEKRIPVGQIVDILIDKHECISDHFYKDSTIDASHLGSKVIDYILEYMQQNYQTLVIPVFDEIICDAEFDHQVLAVMKKAYIHVVGSDMNCMIVREK